MTRYVQKARLFCAATAISILLIGCGGGSSTGAPPSSTVISGVAATGAPLSGSVTIKDSSTPTAKEKTVAIATDGTYSVDTAGMNPPFLLRAESTVGGRTYRIHSAATAKDLGGKINITPLTDLIVANIAGQIAENFYNSGSFSALSDAALTAGVTSLRTQLLPILSALGVNSSIDLLRADFKADHTGLDAALDMLRVTVDPATVKASIQNILNQEKIELDIKVKAYAGTFTATAIAPAGLTTLQAITAGFNAFSNLFATSLPRANDPALLAFFDTTTFLQDGKSLTAFLKEITSGPTFVGLRFTDIVVLSLSPADAPTSAKVKFTFLQGGNARGTVVINLSKINGKWLIAGNQRIAKADAITFARKDFNGTIDTGLLFEINDRPIVGGISYAIVTGKGLPANGLLYVNYQAGNSLGVAQRPYAGVTTPKLFSNGHNQYPLTDTVISTLADDETYTIALWNDNGTPSNLSDDVLLATYTSKIHKRPNLLSDLSSASFASITTTPTEIGNFARSGGTLTAKWTLPVGLSSDNLHFFRQATTSPQDALNVDLAGTATSTILSIGSPSFTVQVSGINLAISDVYLRERTTILNGQ